MTATIVKIPTLTNKRCRITRSNSEQQTGERACHDPQSTEPNKQPNACETKCLKHDVGLEVPGRRALRHPNADLLRSDAIETVNRADRVGRAAA